MKPLTTNIQQWINNPDIHEQMEKIFENSSGFEAFELNIEEAQETYSFLKNTLAALLEKGLIDELTYHKRNAIWNLLKNFQNQLNQVKPHNYNLNRVVNVGNNIFSQLMSAQDQIKSVLIFDENLEYYSYEKETKELSKIKRRFTKLVKDIEASEKILDTITKKEQKYNELLERADSTNKRIIQLHNESESVLQNITGNYDSSNTKLKNIQAITQELENKKLSINTFADNIKEYKNSIEGLINKAKELLSKEDKVDKLILQAEKALNLKK